MIEQKKLELIQKVCQQVVETAQFDKEDNELQQIDYLSDIVALFYEMSDIDNFERIEKVMKSLEE